MTTQQKYAAKAYAMKQAAEAASVQFFPGQDDRDTLLTRAEAAAYLRRSVPTLEAWAREGIGPRVTRMGPRGIRYRLSDLRKFIEAGAKPSAAVEA